MMRSDFPELPPLNRNFLLRAVVFFISIFFFIWIVIVIVVTVLVQAITIILNLLAGFIFWFLGKAARVIGFLGVYSSKVWNFMFSSFLPVCEMCGLPINARFPGKRQQCCGMIAHDGCHERKNSRQPILSMSLFLKKEKKK